VRPHLRLLVLAALVAGLFAAVALSGSISASRVQHAVHRAGVLAPLAFIVLSSLLTVACFPGPVLAAASGVLFGTALGTPISIVAAVTGAVLAFGVARRFGAGAVEELSGERLDALQAAIEARGFVAVFVCRVAPAMPYTLVNYAAGLSRVRLRDFILATAIGASPRAFAYTALGGHIGDLSSPTAVVAFAVLVAMGLIGSAMVLRDPAVRRMLRRLRRADTA
jgi:uncharacterized membrane protein YdjX (TVP38/TMEM64 family)